MSRSMGNRYSTKRLSHRVPRDTKISRYPHNTNSPEFRKEKIIIRRSGRFISQICCERSHRKVSGRVLFNNLFGSKEKRQVETGDKSTSPKLLHHEIQIQNDNIEADYSGGASRRLDAVGGFEGRVFPRTSMSGALEIPEISCGESNIRIHSIAIRHNVSSQGIHKSDGAFNLRRPTHGMETSRST